MPASTGQKGTLNNGNESSDNSDEDNDDDSDEEEDEVTEDGNEATASGRFSGSGGGDGDEALRDSLPATSRLLFIHQEKWQQALLAEYGELTHIDATYRTTNYDLPLFFLVVPTNVGYTVVAEFCIQSERCEDIAEALEVLKSMNPNWTPRHFMTDYSEAEMLAIEQVSFSQCYPFPLPSHKVCMLDLCLFH